MSLAEFLNYTLLPVLGIPLGGWLALNVTKRFVKPKPGKLRYILLVLIHGFTVMMIVFIGDPLNTLIVLAALLGGICLLCEGSLLSRVSVSAIMFTVIVSINAFLDAILHIYPVPFHLLYIALLWFFTRKAVPRVENELAPRLWLLVDIVALTPFASTLLTLIWRSGEFGYEEKQPFKTEGVMVLLFAALSSIAVLLMIIVLARHQKIVQEQNLWQMRRIYYENLEQSQRQIRILRHDMANHLQILAGLQGEAAASYLRQLIGSPAIRGGHRFCENEVVNTVLTVKHLQMEKDGIANEIDVVLPADVPIAEIDLCALFANALDNAIEACRKVSGGDRQIKLQVRAEKGLFILRLENSRAGELKERNGELMTDKADEGNHGLGLASIREIAGRYDGQAKTEYTDTLFTCIVTLPMSNDSKITGNRS